MRAALALLWLSCAASLAWSAEPDAGACRRLVADAARLACYDAAFAPSPAPATASPVQAPAHQAATPAVPAAQALPPQAFGDRGQLPPDRAAKPELPKRVNFKVLKAENLANGLFRLTMDNGQVWVTKEAYWALEFSAGDEVTIQRMALGGYRVSHAGQGRSLSVGRVL